MLFWLNLQWAIYITAQAGDDPASSCVVCKVDQPTSAASPYFERLLCSLLFAEAGELLPSRCFNALSITRHETGSLERGRSSKTSQMTTYQHSTEPLSVSLKSVSVQPRGPPRSLHRLTGFSSVSPVTRNNRSCRFQKSCLFCFHV